MPLHLVRAPGAGVAAMAHNPSAEACASCAYNERDLLGGAKIGLAVGHLQLASGLVAGGAAFPTRPARVSSCSAAVWPACPDRSSGARSRRSFSPARGPGLSSCWFAGSVRHRQMKARYMSIRLGQWARGPELLRRQRVRPPCPAVCASTDSAAGRPLARAGWHFQRLAAGLLFEPAARWIDAQGVQGCGWGLQPGLITVAGCPASVT